MQIANLEQLESFTTFFIDGPLKGFAALEIVEPE
jgi:hypothetical protein